MKQVDKIPLAELKEMAKKMYGNIVKVDIDIAKKIFLVDMIMHADGEAYLLEQGSRQRDLWGINLKPEKYNTDAFVEFDSMINLRPGQGNFSRGVDNAELRAQIITLVQEVVYE